MESDNPYIRNAGKKPYLRCNYGEIIKPPMQGERQVYFETPSKIPAANHLIVNDDEVLIVEDDVGLLRIHAIFPDTGEEGRSINVRSNDDGGLTRIIVPNSEIVWR